MKGQWYGGLMFPFLLLFGDVEQTSELPFIWDANITIIFQPNIAETINHHPMIRQALVSGLPLNWVKDVSCHKLYHDVIKVYAFLRWCHIDILNGLSISLQRCHVLYYLTVLYTHICDFSLMYVICMCELMTCFVRNVEIKLWNHINIP